VHRNRRSGTWRPEWSGSNVSLKAFGQLLFITAGAATPW
jgi:hypothetical protein